MAQNLISRPVNIVHLARIAALCTFLLWLSSAAVAQSRPTQPAPQPSPEDKHDRDMDFGSRVSEMRTVLAIKEEKKAYEENVARAKEAEQLASDLKASYEAKDAFAPEDQKRLERLEKLTRRIRNEAGGSDPKEGETDLPETLKSAVLSLADMAEGLCKEVKQTPRRIVSASIIGKANKLINVIRFVREKVH